MHGRLAAYAVECPCVCAYPFLRAEQHVAQSTRHSGTLAASSVPPHAACTNTTLTL